MLSLSFFSLDGALANRLCPGLQIQLAQFDSGTHLHTPARVVKLVDTTDLKSVALKRAYRFDSGSGHQIPQYNQRKAPNRLLLYF